MANVLTAGFASITTVPLRLNASVIHSFVTPNIYVPYPSAYGNQQQRFFSGAAQPTGTVTVGGSAVSATQTADSYGSVSQGGGSSSGFPIWAIAVTAGVGGAIAFCIIVAIILACMRRKRESDAARRARWLRSQTGGANPQPGYSWFGVNGNAIPQSNGTMTEKPGRMNSIRAAAARRGKQLSPRLGRQQSAKPQKRDLVKERTSFLGARSVPIRPKRPKSAALAGADAGAADAAVNAPKRASSRNPLADRAGTPTMRTEDPSRASNEPLLANGSPNPEGGGAWGPGSPLPTVPARPWVGDEPRDPASPRRGSLPPLGGSQSPYAHNAISGSESSPNLAQGGPNATDALLASPSPRGSRVITSGDFGGERTSRFNRVPNGPRSSQFAAQNSATPHADSASIFPDEPVSPRSSARRAQSMGRPASGADMRGTYLTDGLASPPGGRAARSTHDLPAGGRDSGLTRGRATRDSLKSDARASRAGRKMPSMQGMRETFGSDE